MTRRLTLVLIGLCFVSVAWGDPETTPPPTTPAATGRFNCPAFLAIGRDANVKRFAQGERLHHSLPESQTLDEQTVADLELGALATQWSKGLLTSFGAVQMRWLMSNPSLDSDEIRERQKAVETIRASPDLRAKIRSALDAIRIYEKRDSGWDRFWNWILRYWGFKGLDERSVIKHFTDYNVTPSWRGDLLKIADSAIWPLMALHSLSPTFAASTATFDGVMRALALPSSLNSRAMSRTRTALAQFQNVAVAADILGQTLAGSASAHLQDVSGILRSIADRNHPLQLRSTGRTVRHIWTNTYFTWMVDTFFLGNLPLTKAYFDVRKKLDRLALLASALGELDVLLSFADKLDSGDYVQPEILSKEEPLTIAIEKAKQPLMFALGKKVVANDVHLREGDPNSTQLMFLTGPNARGKSTYMRAIFVNCILAQIGAPVAASSMRITPLRVLTTMRRADSTVDEESLFRSEARRVKKLLATMEKYPRSILAFDEVFSGTSAQEKLAGVKALVHRLARQKRLAVIVSHERELMALEGKLPGFRNFHVSDEDERMFQVETGPSMLRNAFLILEEEGLPAEFIDDAYDFYEGPKEELKERKKPKAPTGEPNP